MTDIICEKGANMFRNKSIDRPIFGLIENMAWFTPAEHPDEKYFIFGRDGGARMAEDLGIELLGRIPLVQGENFCFHLFVGQLALRPLLEDLFRLLGR